MHYSRFLNNAWGNNPANFLRRHRPYYPCPGFIGDPNNRPWKFDKWHKMPNAACHLYWKTRPELYQAMMKHNNLRRAQIKAKKPKK